MKIRSLADWIAWALYWPVLIAAAADITVLPILLMRGWPSQDQLWLATKVQGAVAAILFILAVCDGETRRTVNQYNAMVGRTARSLPWWRRTFQRIGDLRLQICAYCLGGAVIFSFFVATGQAYRTLAGTGFFLTVTVSLLTLKYHLPGKAAQP